MRATILLVTILLVMGTMSAQPGDQTAPEPQRYARVVDGILAAWNTADVVCLGEDHGRKYDHDLRMALVKHPAFPKTVRVIVVEMANPIHQDLLDKFILDGAGMTREEIAPVWRDATGYDVWESPIYEQFLRAVRDVNLALPRDERVRVLGGDTKLDWSRINRAEELVPFMNRGGSIRTIVAEQLLDKHIKGLTIYGAGHCSNLGGGYKGDLYGKYDANRMWSIWPFVRQGAAKGREVFGLGADPAYVVVKGTRWASTPAAGIEPGPFTTRTMGDILDAVVYHGDVPDTVVPADMAALRAKMGAELDRRSKLTREAAKIRKEN